MIRVKLHTLTQRSLVSRIFKQENMAECIAKYKTELRNQIDIFNVCSLLLCRTLGAHFAGQLKLMTLGQIRHGINMQRVMNTQFQMLNVKLESIESKVSVCGPIVSV